MIILKSFWKHAINESPSNIPKPQKLHLEPSKFIYDNKNPDKKINFTIQVRS